MREFDIAIAGAGAAGLSLAHRLAGPHVTAARRPSIAVISPPAGPLRAPARTWCFWERGSGPWDGVLAARWDELAVVGPDAREHRSPIAPHSYKMLRSTDFEECVRSALGSEVVEIGAEVSGIDDGAEHAVVRARRPDGAPVDVAAAWVFDSRPPPALPPARTTLLQHFRGWFVRTGADAFDPDRPLLMDLRTPQPPRGVSFGYVLPLSPREALIEYTEFTRSVLDGAGYDAALRRYTSDVLGLGPFTVAATEQGAIPMTDGRFTTRAGRRVFRIGAAGGATRPSTGYTFSGIQRQVASVARSLDAGRTPDPGLPHHSRHLAMDAVLLRALDTGRLNGAAFFARLFERNTSSAVLDFLDGRSSFPRDLAIGATTPIVPMGLTAMETALTRLRRI